MDLMTLAVVLSSVFSAISAIEYVYLAWKKVTEPTPATWILMFVSFSESVWLYWHTANHDLAGNIANIAGWFNVTFIFCGVMSRHWLDNTLRIAFSPFQKKCLRRGGYIILIWLITVILGVPYGAEVAYVLTQVLAVIAYIPTVRKLREAEKSPEPITVWIAAFLGCLCAIYPAVVLHRWQAWVYLARAIPSSSYVIYLIHRLNVREAKMGHSA